MCFEVLPESGMYQINGVSRERVLNSSSSCAERAGTENKVLWGTCRRSEEKDDLRIREGQ